MRQIKATKCESVILIEAVQLVVSLLLVFNLFEAVQMVPDTLRRPVRELRQSEMGTNEMKRSTTKYGGHKVSKTSGTPEPKMIDMQKNKTNKTHRLVGLIVGAMTYCWNMTF